MFASGIADDLFSVECINFIIYNTMKANNFELIPIGKIEGDLLFPHIMGDIAGERVWEALLNDIWGSK